MYYYFSVETITISDQSADESELEDNEYLVTNIPLTNSVGYYSNVFSETVLSHEINNDNKDVETKSVAYKKKNISQMGRRKANRAQNGIIYLLVLFMFVFYVYT